MESGHKPLPNMHRPSRDSNSQTHNISFNIGTPTAPTVSTGSPAVASLHDQVAAAISPRNRSLTSTSAVEAVPASISAYDEFCSKYLSKYMELSKKIGGLIAEQSEHVEKAFNLLRQVLSVALKAQKPDMDSPELLEFLKPIQSELLTITNIRDEHRTAPEFNQLSTVMSGISILGWVTVEPTPLSFMSEMKDSSQFYANRVMKEFKGKDDLQIEWVRSYLTLLTELITYVKTHFKTGLTWSTKQDAVPLKTALANLSASKTQAPSSGDSANGGLPPPPPPPPPSNDFWKDSNEPAPADNKGDMGAVFAEINKGEGITSGLRKVDKSEMTHKNPNLRKTGPTPGPKPKIKSSAPSKPAETAPVKPPRIELENTKWFVENQVDNHSIVLDSVELNHSVQIFGCSNCTIIIKGKLNTVSMSNCKRTSVVVDTLVAAFDIAKCSNFGCQVMNHVPMIVIDQCDGGSIYLSKSSLSSEVVTSKSTSLNINVPNEEGDYAERAVPEQIKHKVNEKGELVSEIVRHE